MRTIVFQDIKHALRLWNIQCILAWEESQMAKTLLHTGLICGHRPPNLRLHHLGTWNNMTFWSIFCPQCFQGLMLEPYGVPCPSTIPSMLVWKSLGNLEMVLYLGLIFCLWWFSHTFIFSEEVLPVSRSPHMGKTANSPLRKVKWGLFLCQYERKSHTVPVDFQGLFFSGALATAAAIFIGFP